MTDNVDADGVARYPVGQWPILDPQSREVLVDEVFPEHPSERVFRV